MHAERVYDCLRKNKKSGRDPFYRTRQMRRIFFAVAVLVLPLAISAPVSLKLLRPPKIHIDIAWSRTIEHHYHNNTRDDNDAAVQPSPIRQEDIFGTPSPLPTYESYLTRPVPPLPSLRERIDDEYSADALYKRPQKHERQPSKKHRPYYVRVDVHHKNAATRRHTIALSTFASAILPVTLMLCSSAF